MPPDAERHPDWSDVDMWLFLKNLLFTVVVPGSVAVYFPLGLVGGVSALTKAVWGRHQVAAVVPLLLGAAIYLRCVWEFATVGRGTPAPIDAPQKLVVVGLYRYVRNPMYLGVLSVVTGWSVFFWNPRLLVYTGLVALALHLFVVLLEEPILARRFGESYARYCRAVHRWVPGKPYREVA
jgi:protein-S-isoprenylcysteine O-methyltransferase Ste14